MVPFAAVYVHTPWATPTVAVNGPAAVSVVSSRSRAAPRPAAGICLMPVVAVRVEPLTAATVPSACARTSTLIAKGCILSATANAIGDAPPVTRANPVAVDFFGSGFPCSIASNSVGTNVVVNSSWPDAFGCSASHQNPLAHFPVPSSTAPRKLTLGTSHVLISRFMRRVYPYSTSVKVLRV